MLRVVFLVASNFVEAPNGGRAGRNQQRPFSLRERCDCRGNNPRPAAKNLRAVALRTRGPLAKPILSGPDATLECVGSVPDHPGHSELQPTGADRTDRLLRPPRRRRAAIPTCRNTQKRTRHLRRVSLGRRLRIKLIRGASLCRNSHTLFKKHARSMCRISHGN